MTMNIGLLLCLGALLASTAAANPSGPPTSVCNSLTPGMWPHGTMSSGAGSMVIEVKKGGSTATDIEAGGVYTVTLRRTSGTFIGFMLAACDSSTCGSSSNRVGSFSSLPSSTKLMTCDGSSTGTVSHSSNNAKSTHTFTWTAPSTVPDRVYFKATTVVTKTMWYRQDHDLPKKVSVAATFSASIDTDNKVTVTFSEAVERASSGDLTSSSFALSVTSGSISLSSIAVSKTSSTVYVLTPSFSSPPSGGEALSIDVASNQVATSSNAALVLSAAISKTLTDKKAPSFSSSSLSASNVLSITFSEAVTSAAGSSLSAANDFTVALSSGAATLTSSSISGSGASWTLTLTLSGLPDGQEQLSVDVKSNRVKDAAGNFVTPGSPLSATLNDKKLPTFSVSLQTDNTVTVTFDEAVTSSSGSALSLPDFVLQLDSQSISSASVSSVSSTVIAFDLGLSAAPQGNEVVTVNVPASRIKDAAGNFVATTTKQVTLNDKRAPTFSARVQGPNTVVIVTFSEPLSSATKADFLITVQGGSATLDTVAMSTSDDTVFTFTLTLSGTEDGDEQVTVDAKPNALADAAGNVVQSAAITLGLVDLAPTFSVSVQADNSLLVSFSEPVTNSTGGDPALSDFSVSFNANSGSATLSSSTLSLISSSSLRITLSLSDVVVGGDSVTVDVVSNKLKDNADQFIASNATTVLLHDRLLPTFHATIDADNKVTVTFSEAVSAAASAQLTLSHFVLSSSLTGVTWALAVVNATHYDLSPTFTTLPSLSTSTATIDIAANSVFDATGNAAVPKAATVTLTDKTVPTFTLSVSEQAVHTYIATLSFSEPIQSAASLAALPNSAFSVAVSGGYATLSSFSLLSHSLPTSEIQVSLSLTNRVNGLETLSVAASASSVSDAAANLAATTAVTSAMPAASYPSNATLSSTNNVILQWRTRTADNMIDLSLSSASSGWMSLGFNDKPAMKGTDAIVALPGSPPSIQQYLLDQHMKPTSPISPSHAKGVVFSSEDGVTTLSFSRTIQDPDRRLLRADDSRSLRSVDPTGLHVVWATSSSASFFVHSQKGAKRLVLSSCQPSTTCYGRGTCSSSQDEGHCDCQVGYTGAFCDACAANFTMTSQSADPTALLCDSKRVVATLKLSGGTSLFGTEGSATRTNFMAHFQQDVATALGISAARVSILSISPSSGLVKFSIVTAEEANVAAGSRTANDAKRNVQIAADLDAQLDSSGAVLSGTVTKHIDTAFGLDTSYPAPQPSGNNNKGTEVSLHDDLSMHFEVDGDTITVTLTYNGLAWIAMGIQEDGYMVGADVVVGLPNAGTVKEYHVVSRMAAGVQEQAKQDLSKTSLSQINGKTIMTFARKLRVEGDDKNRAFSKEGDTTIVWAIGPGNTFSQHAMRGSRPVNVATGEAGDAHGDHAYLTYIHGICMVVGWAILAPVGAMMPKLFRHCKPTSGPRAFWFVRHKILMILALLAIVGGFIVAVAMTHGAHFDHWHGKIGLLVVILGITQPINAALRPHPGQPRRLLWFTWHRVTAFLALALSIATLFLGLDLAMATMTFSILLALWYLALLVFVGIKLFNGKPLPSSPKTAAPTGIDASTGSQPRHIANVQMYKKPV